MHAPVAEAAAGLAKDRRHGYGLLGLLALLLAVTVYRAVVLQLGGLSLYVDEAQYWTWAQHLDWGFYSKPPVIAAVIAATTAVCGDGELCVKSGALLIYPLVALLIWGIARRLFDARVAFWSAVVFFTLPGAAFSAMIISTDVPLFLCWCAALYAYLRAIEDDRWRDWLAVGVIAGIGLLTKYTMVIFAVSALLHLAVTAELRRHLRNPKLYVGIAVALLVFAPNLWWNARHDWPTIKHTGDISGLEHHAGLHWRELWAFLGGQAAITGPVFLAAWLLQLGGGLRARASAPPAVVWYRDARYRLLACFALPFLGIISLQALLGRANANWAAMTYAAGIIFCVAALVQQRRWRWLGVGLIVNLAATGIAYHYDFLLHTAGVALTRKTDVFKRVRGWPELGARIQALRERYPDTLLLADDRDLLAELEYYVEPHPLDAVAWNPRHVIDNHYALTTTMDDKRGRDFLYVSHDARLPWELARSFDSFTTLPPQSIDIHPDYRLDAHVWLLRGFRGYAPYRP